MLFLVGDIWGEKYWYQNTNVWENERLMRFHPRKPIYEMSVRRDMADERDYVHKESGKSARKILQRGGLVQVGGMTFCRR
jgi:hypothetical protein